MFMFLKLLPHETVRVLHLISLFGFFMSLFYIYIYTYILCRTLSYLRKSESQNMICCCCCFTVCFVTPLLSEPGENIKNYKHFGKQSVLNQYIFFSLVSTKLFFAACVRFFKIYLGIIILPSNDKAEWLCPVFQNCYRRLIFLL